MPKDSGIGKIISAFQSREIGWGLDLSECQISERNKNREGRQYIDREAACAIFGTAEKITLQRSPFIHKFEFGGTNGYCTGNHTIIQVEDCLDCLKVMFREEYEIIFQFDCSSGHAKKNRWLRFA